jgi:hypothetical protein
MQLRLGSRHNKPRASPVSDQLFSPLSVLRACTVRGDTGQSPRLVVAQLASLVPAPWVRTHCASCCPSALVRSGWRLSSRGFGSYRDDAFKHPKVDARWMGRRRGAPPLRSNRGLRNASSATKCRSTRRGELSAVVGLLVAVGAPTCESLSGGACANGAQVERLFPLQCAPMPVWPPPSGTPTVLRGQVGLPADVEPMKVPLESAFAVARRPRGHSGLSWRSLYAALREFRRQRRLTPAAGFRLQEPGVGSVPRARTQVLRRPPRRRSEPWP